MNPVNLILKFFIISALSTQFTEAELKIKVKTDRMLIAPGIGAEYVVIKDSYKELAAAKGTPERVADFKSQKELFRDVYNIRSAINIDFDKICYYEIKKTIVFMKSGEVVAVAGLDRNRVTIDSINLGAGVENFLFNYGNDGLSVIKRGEDKIYMYGNIGIALFDDKGDNVIDMFLVFAAR